MTSPAVTSRYANALVDVVLDPKSGVAPEQVTRERMNSDTQDGLVRGFVHNLAGAAQ